MIVPFVILLMVEHGKNNSYIGDDMSFRCGVCKKAQKARTSATFVVLDRRSVNYEERRKDREVLDRGGAGWEIVQEVMACPDCAKKIKEEP